jgi:hypothetical protein
VDLAVEDNGIRKEAKHHRHGQDNHGAQEPGPRSDADGHQEKGASHGKDKGGGEGGHECRNRAKADLLNRVEGEPGGKAVACGPCDSTEQG